MTKKLIENLPSLYNPIIPEEVWSKENHTIHQSSLEKKISSVKWALGFTIVVLITLGAGMSQIYNYRDIHTEISSLQNSMSEIQKICNNNNSFHSKIFYQSNNFYQFISPFITAIKKIGKENAYSVSQRAEKSIFKNYPTKRCKKIHKQLDNNDWFDDIKLIDARAVFEKQKWSISYPDTVTAISSETKKTQGSIFLSICSIEFLNNFNKWVAQLGQNCLQKSNQIIVSGAIKWKTEDIGPFVQNFDVEYPALSKYWHNYSNVKLWPSKGETNSLQAIMREFTFGFSMLNLPSLKLKGKNLHYLLLIILPMYFYLLLLLADLRHTSITSGLDFGYYFSKWYRYPMILIISMALSYLFACYFLINVISTEQTTEELLMTVAFFTPVLLNSLAIILIGNKSKFSKLLAAVVVILTAITLNLGSTSLFG